MVTIEFWNYGQCNYEAELFLTYFLMSFNLNSHLADGIGKCRYRKKYE